MTCNKTNCPDILGGPDPTNMPPYIPRGTGYIPRGADGINYLQAMPPDFKRVELQSIRDRARGLSIQGSPAKTVEERLYQQMADIADQLDALSARFEAEVAEMNRVTIRTERGSCGKPGCCGNPKVFMPFIGVASDPIGDLNT